MKSIWLANLPIPPSVNASLAPHAMKKQSRATGKQYWGGYLRPTPQMIMFKQLIHVYKVQHGMKLAAVAGHLKQMVEQGWVLRVDVYVAWHEPRVFSSPNKKILQLDANNRTKAILDGVVTLLGIDDSVFFRGDCEKVTTTQKESECVMVRIQPVRPRTLEQIKILMREELSS